jgi:hypothetical protein
MAWAKLPTAWIRELKLQRFTWRDEKSDATAALILLVALAIRLNLSNIGKSVDGEARRASFRESYDNLHAFTGLSRAKISAGLRLLERLEIVRRTREKRMNCYTLNDLESDTAWGQLPQSHLLDSGTFVFSKFQLRHRNELNALKLYLLLIAYRFVKGNFTAIGYEKICEISGMMRNDIPQARALLINYDLIRVEEGEPMNGQTGRPHTRYKVRGLGFNG